jgi:hypothetical protein
MGQLRERTSFITAQLYSVAALAKPTHVKTITTQVALGAHR